MLSRPQIMKLFKCTAEEAATFLNAANEINVLDLEPFEALEAVSKHMRREIVAHMFAYEFYDPKTPRKDLN